MNALSFQVRRDAPGSLTEQVVRGFRAAVQTGHLTPGERLPTLNAMAGELGVSPITMRRAVARLAADGMLEVQRKTGIRVRLSQEPHFRAHVLFVTPGSPFAYYYATRNHAFLEIMREHDVLVTTAHVSGKESSLGFPAVRHVLDTQSVTLAVLEGEWLGREHALLSLLAGCGIRFVQTWGHRSSPDALETLRMDIAPACRQLARHCARCGLNEVIVLSGLKDHSHDFCEAAQSVGLQVKRREIGRPSRDGSDEIGVEREGHSTLARLLKRRHPERGLSMILAMDDYAARGAMTAILEAGLRIPRDIQLATLVNVGHMPVASVPLTRIEMHPVRDGEAMAQMVLRNLASHRRRYKPLVVRPPFVAGKSTRRVVCSRHKDPG